MAFLHIRLNTAAKIVFCNLILCNAFRASIAVESKLGSHCTVQNSRKTPGVCTKLDDCSLLKGSKEAGITPTKCHGPISGSKSKDLVCCRTVKRISRQKCEEYSSIFKETNIKADSTQFSVYDCPEYITTFISGGDNAVKSQFPHQAAIGYDVKAGEIVWRCGGTLISEEYVLTAGHCIRDSKAPAIKVMLGGIYLPGPKSKPEPNRIEVPIAKIIVHPQYFPPSTYNDIALIKLAHPVNISRDIFPACLPIAEYRFDEIPNVEATGWGQLGAFDDTSEVLQTVNIKRFDGDCNTYFNNMPERKSRLPEGIISTQFCAGDKVGQGDTCRGDSGGPVTVHKDDVNCIFYVVGVTSFGSSLCGYQEPGVYTNVQGYMDWIEDNVWPKSLYNTTNYPYETINTTKIIIKDPSRIKHTNKPFHKSTTKPTRKSTTKPIPKSTTTKPTPKSTTTKPTRKSTTTKPTPKSTTSIPLYNISTENPLLMKPTKHALTYAGSLIAAIQKYFTK